MAQTNDSQVSTPVITFQVNLETVSRYDWVQPNRTTTDGNETVAEADEQKNLRTMYIPGLLIGENQEGIGGIGNGNGINQGYLRHGQQFTVKGAKALYLKKVYVTGSPSDLLQIVSQT